MKHLSTSELPITPAILKSAIQEARSVLIQQKNNNSQYDYELFVASQQIEEKFGPDADALAIALDEEDHFEQLEIFPLIDQLTTIQQLLTDNLQVIISGTIDWEQPRYLRILGETPEHYFIHDPLEILREWLEEECGVSQTAIISHRIAAKKRLERMRIDFPEDDHPVWIIAKPPGWWHGQQAVSYQFINFIQNGFTATEAFDYWIISVMGAYVPHWADIRGKVKSTIYNRLQSVEDKFSEAPQITRTDNAQYELTSKYVCRKNDDGYEFFTINGGILHPRRDIGDPSAKGTMRSDEGAGGKQLAYAVLADLRSRHQSIPLIGQFNDDELTVLATQLHGNVKKLAEPDGDGGWVLTEDRLIEWIWEQMDEQ